MEQLKASKDFEVRFSEVDSMKFTWHGSYPLYFEDAREAFGAKYGLSYLDIQQAGLYAPLVDLNFHYRQPLLYGMHPRIDIYYVPTPSAKIVFRYEIRDRSNEDLLTYGESTQVFLDSNYRLIVFTPPFYEAWKKRWGVME